MKYRAKRDFLGVTKGMEFATTCLGNIEVELFLQASPLAEPVRRQVTIDPEQYRDDFELVEEPKYTDSDLDDIANLFYMHWLMAGYTTYEAVKLAIAELKQSKEKK